MADDPPAGVPEWIVTYGDMMSLLLTFFIMLVSLSEVKGNAKYQAMIESIIKYMGYKAGPQAPYGEGFPLSGLIEKLKSLGSHTNTDRGAGGVKRPGPEGDDLQTFKGREGTSISVGGALAFGSADAEISPAVEDVLRTIAIKLAGKPNKIDIRGHTSPDPLPEDSPYSDKFQLSYERARSVLEALHQQGIQRERMRVSAAADTEPLPPSADKKAIKLDRVEIFVLDAYAKDFIGPRDVRD